VFLYFFKFLKYYTQEHPTSLFFHILALTETWLKVRDFYEPAEICPPEYTILREDREERKGGGVAIMCKKEYKPNRIKTGAYHSFEHLSVKLKSTPFFLRIVVIYTPPSSSIKTFLSDFGSFLEDNALSGSPFILAADFNLHWEDAQNKDTERFREILSAFGLSQHISESTHIKGHVLDLIITRYLDHIAVMNPTIGELLSDHHLIFSDI
jgi:exonuclease III